MGVLSWLRLEKTRLLTVRNSLNFCPQSLSTSVCPGYKIRRRDAALRTLDRAQGDRGLALSAKTLVILLMATAVADHMHVKWTCKAGWWEWVGLAPPHLQNGLTQVDSYWLLSLAWIYQRAERAHPRWLISKEIKSAGQNTVLATVSMNVKHVSAPVFIFVRS